VLRQLRYHLGGFITFIGGIYPLDEWFPDELV